MSYHITFYMFSSKLFSKRIHDLRINTGTSQPTLGKFLGISKQSVSRMEAGEHAANIEVLCLIADYFDVSVDYLVGHTDDPARR